MWLRGVWIVYALLVLDLLGIVLQQADYRALLEPARGDDLVGSCTRLAGAQGGRGKRSAALPRCTERRAQLHPDHDCHQYVLHCIAYALHGSS